MGEGGAATLGVLGRNFESNPDKVPPARLIPKIRSRSMPSPLAISLPVSPTPDTALPRTKDGRTLPVLDIH